MRKMIMIGLIIFTVTMILGCVENLDDNCEFMCMGNTGVITTMHNVRDLCIGQDNTNFSKPFDCKEYALKQAREYCKKRCEEHD